MTHALLGAIPAEGIRIGMPAATWHEVVDGVGQLLVDSGFATAEYTTAIADSIQRNGPYLVIAPGLALLHARPEEGALAPGLVLATLTEPVAFGHSTNDPVTVALGLTAVDSEGHLDALVAIANTFSRPDAVATIAGAASPEDLTRRLLELETKEQEQL